MPHIQSAIKNAQVDLQREYLREEDKIQKEADATVDSNTGEQDAKAKAQADNEIEELEYQRKKALATG